MIQPPIPTLSAEEIAQLDRQRFRVSLTRQIMSRVKRTNRKGSSNPTKIEAMEKQQRQKKEDEEKLQRDREMERQQNVRDDQARQQEERKKWDREKKEAVDLEREKVREEKEKEEKQEQLKQDRRDKYGGYRKPTKRQGKTLGRY